MTMDLQFAALQHVEFSQPALNVHICTKRRRQRQGQLSRDLVGDHVHLSTETTVLNRLSGLYAQASLHLATVYTALLATKWSEHVRN